MRGDVQNYLDLAFDYLSASLIEEAVDVLQAAPRHMIVSYALASLGEEGDDPGSTDGSCFANRLEEMILLQDAIARRPNDSIAAYHLGNFLYDRRRYSEAIELWEKSVAIEPDNSIAWRNLGIAYHNVSRDSGRAREAYDRALVADPSDARILFERDQLLKRIGVIPAKRLSELEGHSDLIELRDDLTLEYCALLNATGQQERSRDILLIRRFSPWEGGEGMALAQHCRTYLLLAKKAIRSQDPAEAVRLLQTALSAPENLGEARHLLANVSDLWVALGDAYHANGQIDEARHTWLRAAEFRGDFQEMSVRTYSEMTYYRALALKRLGRGDEAMLLLQGLAGYAQDLMYRPAKIDYFATSLPSMLLFEDDLQARQETTALFLAAQASLGLEDRSDARRILSSIIARDPNHSQAQDLLSECE